MSNIAEFVMIAVIAVSATAIAVILTRDANYVMNRCKGVMDWCEDELVDLRDEEDE